MATYKQRRTQEMSKEHPASASAPAPATSSKFLLEPVSAYTTGSRFFLEPTKGSSRQHLSTLILMALGIAATLRLFFHQLHCDDSILLRNLASRSSEESCVLPPLPPIQTRQDIALVLEQMNFTTGIEIGVQQGLFAEYNLKFWPSCRKYKLVDLWKQQPNYFDSANLDNLVHETFYQATKERLKPWEGFTEYYRMYSSEAAKLIAKEGEQVDFVYVDARHDYCGCKEDIEMYWPLVKPGGILAGHDFMANYEVAPQDWSVCMDGSIHPEAVKGAVMEFANKHNLPVGVTYRETHWNSWWIRKPLC
ncbi:expressed unknown protein [Seminavis robusta]|uniref:Methyltransferase n=1 Tax=Seminavis robusta TaxID=568900 RepID=A0A9N8DQN1_9STRA|nr:expressed unknown protein [Seminavis robusta]|eukprot:Sro286_g108280.1 n/a (306) ;mRNA; f:30703-31620